MLIDNEIVKNTISSNIKHYRRKANLTQEQLAEKINVSFDFVQSLEYARSGISIVTLLNLCNALNVTPNDILKDFIVKPLNEQNINQQIDVLPDYEKKAILNLIDYFNNNNFNR